MKRHLIGLASAVALVLASHAGAQDGSQTPLASNFLYNYYTQPGASQVTAGMYPAPYWVPPNVGHTYYTYQPLMPHELMYEHRRNYYQSFGDNPGYHSGAYGWNKTTVVWQNGASHVGPFPFSKSHHHHAACCGIGHGCGPHGCATGTCQ
jgi:hypothetical protein